MYEVLIRTSDGPLVASFSDQTLDSLCGDASNDKNRHLVGHFLCCWLALLSDSPLAAEGLKPRHLYVRFIARVISDGLLETLKRYSGLADALMLSQHETGSADLTNQWVDGFCDTPVFREYHSFYKTRSPQLMQFLLSFCLFGKKLKLDTPAWHAIAFRDWLGVEERLSSLDLSGVDLLVVKTIVRNLVDAVDFRDLYPKFGPGRVAERGLVDAIDKAVNLRYHPYLDLVVRRDDAATTLAKFFSNREAYYPLTSLLRLVYKDITKSRSICMEPSSVMFLQQALLDKYRVAMAVGSISRFVDLSDQTRNQRAAQYGSFSGDVDTIDLSSASDSVSWDLVKKIFPKEHLFYLALTRTADVKTPDGRVVHVRKFAPMGSALCFPVQCIVFTALAIYTAMLHDGWLDKHRDTLLGGGSSLVFGRFLDHFNRYEGFIRPTSGKIQPLRVYGDDICLDSRLTTQFIRVLTLCGFLVNEKKSFMASSAVRESCGEYYFRGYAVTPLRYSLRGQESRRDPEFAAASIALSNRAGDMGFFALKKFMTHVLLFSSRGVKLPYMFSDDRDRSYAFYSIRPKNDHLVSVGRGNEQPKGSHCVDWQRREYQCLSFIWKDIRTPKSTETEAYDRYLWMRWWASRPWEEKQTITMAASHRVTAGCRLRLVWTPA